MLLVSTKLTGFSRIVHKLRQAPKRLDAELKRRLTRVGLYVQKESRRNAKFRQGGLERSIQYEVVGDDVKIFVPNNSEAGKYAAIQHDKVKGRGPKTVDKGSRAGWKFIERAIDDNKRWIRRELKSSFKVIT